MSKWPNSFISGKLFQKRPNGNPETRKTRKEAREERLVATRRFSMRLPHCGAFSAFENATHCDLSG
jgi:hypothetical protein